MSRSFLFLFLALVIARPALADENDRMERRELRDRRAQMRVAVERVNHCIRTGNLIPCLRAPEDIVVQKALFALYQSRRNHSVNVDVAAMGEITP